MNRQDKLSHVPADVLAKEIGYVLGATGWWSRVWRSARAAWRCARMAARARGARARGAR